MDARRATSPVDAEGEYDTTLGLRSLEHVISNRKLRWAGHVCETHGRGLVQAEAPSQVPHVVGRRTSLQRTGITYFYGHDLTRELQLIGFNLDRAAVQLGVSPLTWVADARDRRIREMAQARSSATAGACGNEPIPEQART
jgi:hypothetical protein